MYSGHINPLDGIFFKIGKNTPNRLSELALSHLTVYSVASCTLPKTKAVKKVSAYFNNCLWKGHQYVKVSTALLITFFPTDLLSELLSAEDGSLADTKLVSSVKDILLFCFVYVNRTLVLKTPSIMRAFVL